MKKRPEPSYELLIEGASLRHAHESPRARDLVYRCQKCEGLVPSGGVPIMMCACRNITIDVDYIRLVVEDLSQFQVLRRHD